MSRLYSILTPVFTDPDFAIDEGRFGEYIEQAGKLGFYAPFELKAPVEGSLVPSEEDFLRSRELREKRGERRVPLPPEEPSVNLGKMDAVIKEAEALEIAPKDVPGPFWPEAMGKERKE
jgi:hypothetical protein